MPTYHLPINKNTPQSVIEGIEAALANISPDVQVFRNNGYGYQQDVLVIKSTNPINDERLTKVSDD